MDNYLFTKLHERHVEQPNQLVLNGINDRQSADVLKICIERIKSYAVSWPDWFKFLDLRRPLPHETVTHMIKRGKGTAVVEISENSVFMAILHLEIDGEEMLRPIWLPYMKDSCLLLDDLKYQVSMVMSDGLFSVDKAMGKVFLGTSLKKITFERFTYAYKIDDNYVHDCVAHALLYMNSDVVKERRAVEISQHVNMSPTLLHYLCTQDGLQGTIAKYLGVDIVVGDSTNVTTLDYPDDEWRIASSTKVKPKAFKKDFMHLYAENDVRIAWKIKDDSRALRRLVAGALYVIDHHPKHMTYDVLDNKESWRTSLGRVYFTYRISDMERKISIGQHLEVIKLYFDNDKRIGFVDYPYFDNDINDFYDLMYGLSANMPEILRDADPGSLFNKRVTTMDSLLSDFFYEIGNITLMFQNPKKIGGVSPSSVKQSVRVKLHLEAWTSNFRRSRGTRHGEVRILDSTCPCKAVKVTTAMIQQDEVKSSRKNRDITIKEQYYTNKSIMSIGSTTQQPKHQCDGRAIMNSGVIVDGNYAIRQARYLEPLMRQADRILD